MQVQIEQDLKLNWARWFPKECLKECKSQIIFKYLCRWLNLYFLGKYLDILLLIYVGIYIIYSLDWANENLQLAISCDHILIFMLILASILEILMQMSWYLVLIYIYRRDKLFKNLLLLSPTRLNCGGELVKHVEVGLSTHACMLAYIGQQNFDTLLSNNSGIGPLQFRKNQFETILRWQYFFAMFLLVISDSLFNSKWPYFYVKFPCFTFIRCGGVCDIYLLYTCI